MWQSLTSLDKLNDIINQSHSEDQLIFKHSTRCGISSMVLKQFQKSTNIEDAENIHLLDLIKYREISNKIAEDFDVRHESPQVLVIKDGVAINHASHHNILDIPVPT